MVSKALKDEVHPRASKSYQQMVVFVKQYCKCVHILHKSIYYVNLHTIECEL